MVSRYRVRKYSPLKFLQWDSADWWLLAGLVPAQTVAMEPPRCVLYFCMTPTNLWWHQFLSSSILLVMSLKFIKLKKNIKLFITVSATTDTYWFYSNTRWFYLSMWNPAGVKGLTTSRFTQKPIYPFTPVSATTDSYRFYSVSRQMI